MDTFLNEDKVKFKDLPIEIRKRIAAAKQEAGEVEIWGGKGWAQSYECSLHSSDIYRIPPKKLALDVWVPVFRLYLGTCVMQRTSYGTEKEAIKYGKIDGRHFIGVVHVYKEFPDE